MHHLNEERRRDRAAAKRRRQPDGVLPKRKLRRDQNQWQAEKRRGAGRQRRHVGKREQEHDRAESALAEPVDEFANADSLARTARDTPKHRGKARAPALLAKCHGTRMAEFCDSATTVIHTGLRRRPLSCACHMFAPLWGKLPNGRRQALACRRWGFKLLFFRVTEAGPDA